MAVQIDEGALHAMFADPDGPIGQIIEKKTIQVETVAKVLVDTPGSGRFYPKGSYFLNRDGKVYHWVRDSDHTASAGGEPPSSDTGNLLGSIGHRLGVDEYVYGEVYANARYASWLELGTRYMAPRPFLRPALATL